MVTATLQIAVAAVFFFLQGKLDAGTAAIAAGSLALCYWLAFIIKNWRWPGSEPLLLPLAAWMNTLGLVFLYQLKPEMAARQLIWIMIGLLFLTLLGFVPRYFTLVEYKYIGAGIALALLVATLLAGTTGGGARSWLQLGVLRFQPVELVKIIMVVFLAGYLEDQMELLQVTWRQFGPLGLPAPQALLPLLVIWGVSLLLVASQRDLGGALLLFVTMIAMLYLATGRRLYLGAGFILLLMGFGAGYLLFGHVRERVQVWLNPWAAYHGPGYQVVQGLFAMASGGLVGTGLGLGHPGSVPAITTDYLFVAVAEEMGLAGALALVGLYLIFTWRGLRIAINAPDRVGQLLAGGLAALFGLQCLIIMAGVAKLLPLTGVTLPFFSYGGSSTVVSYLLMGLLLEVSRSRSVPATEEE